MKKAEISCIKDTGLEERGYDVEITDTEASDDLLYEEVLTVVCNSLYTNTHFFFFQGYQFIQEVFNQATHVEREAMIIFFF